MPALAEMKRQGKPISALTAYDYATSRLVDEAGIDLMLVGDSLAMVVLGHENTLAVTVDEMLHHTRAVRRAVRRALVVADMPFGSYHGTVAEGVGQRHPLHQGSRRRGGQDRRPAHRTGPRPHRGRNPRCQAEVADNGDFGARECPDQFDARPFDLDCFGAGFLDEANGIASASATVA